MTIKLSRRIQMAASIASLLILGACATTAPHEPVKAVAQASEVSTQTTIAKGKFETPPEIHPASMTKMIAEEETTGKSAPEQDRSFGKSGTRINSKESQVNVRFAPSTKSAVLVVLKAGQAIQVLETKDSWVRISWMQGVTPRNGWIKKAFVEGN
jgi:uncharacterized protein YgiM (DUF1202 family)